MTAVQQSLGRYEEAPAHERGTVAYREGISAAEVGTLETPLSGGALLRSCRGRTTLAVAASDDTGGVTLRLLVVLYSQIRGSTVFLGFHDRTFVSDAALIEEAGRFASPLQLFDLTGASHYEVRVASLGAASAVDLRAWEV